jgi:ABC-2 type transport system ATP-binding protein
VVFQLRNIAKSYGKKKVFSALSLTFEEGEFVTLVGKNGAGKSTLMRCLAQAEGIDEGMCYYRGASYDDLSQTSMAEVFFLHENFVLPGTKTIGEWADWLAVVSGTFDRGIYQNLVRSLTIDESQTFQQLSRGQRMKSVFSIFAARRPKVYLMDEVTSMLDSGSRFALTEFLRAECASGATVVLTTNTASEMIGCATRLVVLQNHGVTYDSKVNNFGEVFVKIRLRCSEGERLKELEARGGRRLRINGSDFWTVVVRRDQCPSGYEQDSREITMEDVSHYFTSTGERI